MADHEITDSVLKRHNQQHTDSGSTPVAGSPETNTTHTAGNNAAAGSHAPASASGPKDEGGGGIAKWLVPIALIAALAWGAYTYLLPGTKDAVSTATDATKDAATSVAEAVEPSTVGDEVNGLFASATDTLGSITDADSATAALPALGELGTKVDSVSGMLDALPEAARGPIATAATASLGQLQPVLDKVLAIPGVGDIVSPVIDPIMEKLQGFGG